MREKTTILKKLEELSKIIPVGLFWADRKGIILGANDLVISHFGSDSASNLLGKSPYDLYSKELADKIVQNNEEVIRTQKTISFKEEINTIRTHELKYFTTIKSPLMKDDGEIIGVIGVCIDITEEKKEEARLKKAKIFEHLEMIGKIIPAPFYWLDANNVVMGINDLVIKIIGGRTPSDFIGKNPYELYPKDMADIIVQANEEIMRTGKIISQEEPIEDIITGQSKCFTAVKAPLLDDDGKIIGTIGISIDITAEKEAERLRLESELQKQQLEEQDKFKVLADQVAHDIRSPLASLLMVVKSCEEIPEAARIALREAASTIGDIANSLLDRYRPKESHVTEYIEKAQPISVALALLQILTNKRYQFQNHPVEFESEFSQEGYFAFIDVQPVAFKRMISNLINNAVEACVNKKGKIKLGLDIVGSRVIVKIKDNGKGMSTDTIDKIKQKVPVISDKPNSHGIGLIQVNKVLERNNGLMNIDSEVDVGTEIALSFGRALQPSWFVDKITLRTNDVVVVLDDDTSIHGAWDTRFKNYTRDKNIILKHFTHGGDAIEFIKSAANKENIFLLTDFELLKQELNGLHVIKESAVERSILVTSHYANQTVIDLATKSGTKILPKQLASEIPIIIEDEINSLIKNSVVDIVIVDDNKLFTESLSLLFKNKKVDVYNNPNEFLDSLSMYSKNTIIFVDNDLGCDLKGIEVLEKLHEKEFHKLFLLSGSDFYGVQLPEYLSVINKTDIDKIVEAVA